MELTKKDFRPMVGRRQVLVGALASVGAVMATACGDSGTTSGSGGGGTGGAGTGGASTTSSNGGGATTSSTGGAGTGGAGTGGSAPTNCTETIANNHGHQIDVTAADVAAAADKTYDIMGTSPHSHNVVVTAADFGMLAGGSTVTITSSTTNDHSHVVTITC